MFLSKSKSKFWLPLITVTLSAVCLPCWAQANRVPSTRTDPQSTSETYGDRQSGYFGDSGQGAFGNPGEGNFNQNNFSRKQEGSVPKAPATPTSRTAVKPAPYVSLQQPADKAPAAAAGKKKKKSAK